MVFIGGINIHEQTLIRRALQSFYGIGPKVCTNLCAKFSIHQTAKLGSLPASKITALSTEMSKMTLENDLRKELRDNIVRLRELGAYRGRRHSQGLPVRGQKTKKQIMIARRLNKLERRG